MNSKSMGSMRRSTHDINNYIYIPSLAGAIVSLVLFSIVTGLLIHRLVRYRVKYPIIFVVGSAGEAIGYFFRTLSASGGRARLVSFPLFLLMDMFIILSPLAFMAGLYVTFGRLVRRFSSSTTTTTTAGQRDGERIKYSVIPPRYYARLFVTCDITSFLIQAAGAGLIVSSDSHTANLGKSILMAGLAFGFITFFTFVLCVTWSVLLIRRHKAEFEVVGLSKDWKTMIVGLLVSSTCIVARTIYRIIEFADGYHGHIYTTEWYLYVFDTTLMFICIAIWVPLFPAKFGLSQSLTGRLDEEVKSTDSSLQDVSALNQLNHDGKATMVISGTASST